MFMDVRLLAVDVSSKFQPYPALADETALVITSCQHLMLHKPLVYTHLAYPHLRSI